MRAGEGMRSAEGGDDRGHGERPDRGNASREERVDHRHRGRGRCRGEQGDTGPTRERVGPREQNLRKPFLSDPRRAREGMRERVRPRHRVVGGDAPPDRDVDEGVGIRQQPPPPRTRRRRNTRGTRGPSSTPSRAVRRACSHAGGPQAQTIDPPVRAAEPRRRGSCAPTICWASISAGGPGVCVANIGPSQVHDRVRRDPSTPSVNSRLRHPTGRHRSSSAG